MRAARLYRVGAPAGYRHARGPGIGPIATGRGERGARGYRMLGYRMLPVVAPNRG